MSFLWDLNCGLLLIQTGKKDKHVSIRGVLFLTITNQKAVWFLVFLGFVCFPLILDAIDSPYEVFGW